MNPGTKKGNPYAPDFALCAKKVLHFFLVKGCLMFNVGEFNVRCLMFKGIQM